MKFSFTKSSVISAATLLLTTGNAIAAEHVSFPPPLSDYPTNPASLTDTLIERIRFEPFNLVATIIFVLAIVHTFLAPVFTKLSHELEHKHRAKVGEESEAVSFPAQFFHFLGEVEAIFGIWVVPLAFALTMMKGWGTAKYYIAEGLNFTEPLFVVVIMAISATRPILRLAEQILSAFASLGRGAAAAWWLSILTLAPLLGSLITEPAAMTIAALLLSQKFYERRPSPKLAYATMGLLFVNVSVGGTLTHFAAPPVLMVAGKWGWGITDMLRQFGGKAVTAIVISNSLYALYFRKEFRQLQPLEPAISLQQAKESAACIPLWVTLVHVLFLVWTVVNSHYPVLFIGGFLFFLAFTQATEHHQDELSLRQPLLVGFFLAGLVIHGGLQGWWLGPVLRSLSETSLLFGATILTAFNDNAAITYLATLVPNFSAELKYAIVAGAVAGGGLTVIANAPNPAGQSILSKFFPDGVSALKLFVGALIPTAIVVGCFFFLK